MRLHVLAGCRELLQPVVLTPEMAAATVGPRVRVPTAYWISPKCGKTYHNFLQDEPDDCRTTVMALALKDEFGTRFEPLLVLPDLLDEVSTNQRRAIHVTDRRSQCTVLSEILACGHVTHLQLYGLAIPAKADPDGSWAVPAGIVPGIVRNRIEKLRAISAADISLDGIETHVIEVTPDLSAFNTLYSNSVCNQLSLKLAPLFHELGGTCDHEMLAAAVFKIVADWNDKGVFPSIPLLTRHLDAMTEVVYERLLQG